MELPRFSLLCSLLACSSPPSSDPPPSSTARAVAPPTEWSLDSARAAALACEVARDLRPEELATECRVEAVQEEADGFSVRVRETATGGAPLDFPRSIVRLSKDSASVTISRVPQL